MRMGLPPRSPPRRNYRGGVWSPRPSENLGEGGRFRKGRGGLRRISKRTDFVGAKMIERVQRFIRCGQVSGCTPTLSAPLIWRRTALRRCSQLACYLRAAFPASRTEQASDPVADVVANFSDALHRLALRIFERPVIARETRYVRASLSAPHRDE